MLASLPGVVGDDEDFEETRVNFGMRSFSDIIDCEDPGVVEAVDVTVVVDADAVDRPNDVGGVMVELLLALDFFSDDRTGGGGKGVMGLTV